MLVVEDLPGGVKLLTPQRFADARGWLSEIYAEDSFRAAGVHERFVQDNASRTPQPGVVRGLHLQRAPCAQAKLFRSVRGPVFNIVVDLRPDRFGAVDARVIEDGVWVYVPKGFAHGFQTLGPDTEAHYKLDAPFAPSRQAALDWADPALGVRWPLPPRADLASERDRGALPLAAFRPAP